MKKIIQTLSMSLFFFSITVPSATQKFNKDLSSFIHSERNDIKHSLPCGDNFDKVIPTALTGISVSWMLQSLGVSAETLPPTSETLSPTSHIPYVGFRHQSLARMLLLSAFIVIVTIIICYRYRKRVDKCINYLTTCGQIEDSIKTEVSIRTEVSIKTGNSIRIKSPSRVKNPSQVN